MAEVDVVFVVAPFYSLARPNLAVGILQSLCADAGFRCRTLYANLHFSVGMDPHSYEEICELGSAALFGEWLFSGAVFPSSPRPDEREYLQHLTNLGIAPALVSAGLDARNAVADYVQRMCDLILAHSPKIVGFTTTFQQTLASLAIMQAVRARHPDIVMCMGGANCDPPMGEFLADHFDCLDHVFAGEAEHSFLQFVRSAARLGFDRGRLREAHGKVVKGAASDTFPRYPVPAFADYFQSLADLRLVERVEPSIPFESSRGCWWGEKHHCTFCGLNGTSMRSRTRPAADVLREIADHVSRYKVESLHSVDNILSTEHLKDLVPGLRDRFPGCVYFYEVKSNLKHQQLELLASANVIWVQPGIESLKDDALRLMKKGVTAAHNLRFLRDCRELGIYPAWNWLFGFPGEDLAGAIDDAITIIDKIPHLVPPNGPLRIRLDRFSPNFENRQQYGFANVRPFVDYGHMFPGFPESEIARYSYFFRYEAWDSESPPGVKRLGQALQRWRERSIKRAPDLRIFDFADGGGIVIDTRKSRRKIKLVDALERRVLNIVREPMSHARVLELCVDDAPAHVAHAIHSLVKHEFVVACSGLYVSVVCEDTAQRIAPQARMKYPLGRVKPPPTSRAPMRSRQRAAAFADSAATLGMG